MSSFPSTGASLPSGRLYNSLASGATLPGRRWKMGIARDPAEELATLARRSLAALRRKRASTPAVLTPLWAEPQAARALLPALLAGRWRDNHSVDREVITRLATRDYRDYNEVSETLLRWANAADPPVRRVGDTWMVVSSEDAWSLLARALTRDDLERFEAVVLDVLGAVDPRYELPLGERWAAAIYGRTLSHSSDLREGLAEALALMGASSDLYPLADVRTGAGMGDAYRAPALPKCPGLVAVGIAGWPSTIAGRGRTRRVPGSCRTGAHRRAPHAGQPVHRWREPPAGKFPPYRSVVGAGASSLVS